MDNQRYTSWGEPACGVEVGEGLECWREQGHEGPHQKNKRKRVRFGCTLAPDVMDMLGALRPVLALTRTHIIERAVRDLYGREHDRLNGPVRERLNGRLVDVAVGADASKALDELVASGLTQVEAIEHALLLMVVGRRDRQIDTKLDADELQRREDFGPNGDGTTPGFMQDERDTKPDGPLSEAVEGAFAGELVRIRSKEALSTTGGQAQRKAARREQKAEMRAAIGKKATRKTRKQVSEDTPLSLIGNPEERARRLSAMAEVANPAGSDMGKASVETYQPFRSYPKPGKK